MAFGFENEISKRAAGIDTDAAAATKSVSFFLHDAPTRQNQT